MIWMIKSDLAKASVQVTKKTEYVCNAAATITFDSQLTVCKTNNNKSF